jgi:hypothetical protein
MWITRTNARYRALQGAKATGQPDTVRTPKVTAMRILLTLAGAFVLLAPIFNPTR